MAKNTRDIHERRLAFWPMLAKTFSSKINAAIVNCKKPMAIDQNVNEVLVKSFENFLVATTDIANEAADRRVSIDPEIKSEEKFKDPTPLVDKRRTDPPTIPRASAIHFWKVSFSFKIVFPKNNTNNGLVSMMAAERLEGIYLSPAN